MPCITTDIGSLHRSSRKPFVVNKCIGQGAYRLILSPQLRCLHPVFPVVKLALAHPDPILGRQPALPPPPTLIDGEKKYKVKTILDSWMSYNCLEYLVKWKGYDKSHNQWEDHMQLHTKSKIMQFHRKHPGAACHINAAIFDSIPFTRVDLATSWKSSCVVMQHL
jgi:hypothetical protein